MQPEINHSTYSDAHGSSWKSVECVDEYGVVLRADETLDGVEVVIRDPNSAIMICRATLDADQVKALGGFLVGAAQVTRGKP